MAATPTVRTAHPAELDLLADVYERAHFGASLVAVDRFARVALGGEVFVAEREGEVVGASACAHFGATGWIGGVAVVPEARRAGLGRALTEVAVACLRQRGARTIQLYATDMGRPVYERLGFVPEGTCITLAGPWRPQLQPPHTRAADAQGRAVAVGRAGALGRGVAKVRGGAEGRAPADDRRGAGNDRRAAGAAVNADAHDGRVGVREAREGDLGAALALDRQATGEDRAALLRSMWPGTALVVEADGGVRGYHLPSPWRPGGATVAADLSSGLALVEAIAGRLDGSALSLSIPGGNGPAIGALEAWGLTERSRATRMRLGPPIPWQARAVFSTFNLFWG